MQVFRNRDEFIHFRKELLGSTGIVPTMGNLHKGHLKLVRKSLEENDNTIVTIFVNPKQFAPGEDFEKYPRTLEEDLQELKRTLDEFPEKKAILFAPGKSKEIYPEGYQTIISVTELVRPLCGKHRPGHFHGVTTVVYQLFAIVRPDRAYFGQKDYQQFKVLERMTIDMGLPIELTMFPIVRGDDGLALSSRNQYLSEQARKDSLTLPETLIKLETILKQDGLEAVFKARKSSLKDQRWQYLEVLDAQNLRPPHFQTKEVVIAGALFQGSTRLIDNRLVSL
jgi:pantoate--beta-alanine ligase